jgi:hypothetical protein
MQELKIIPLNSPVDTVSTPPIALTTLHLRKKKVEKPSKMILRHLQAVGKEYVTQNNIVTCLEQLLAGDEKRVTSSVTWESGWIAYTVVEQPFYFSDTEFLQEYFQKFALSSTTEKGPVDNSN